MRAGFYRKPKEPEKFPDYGRGKCRLCGISLPPGKRFYCSNPHGIEYKIRTATYTIVSWGDIRSEVLKRDNFTCQECYRKDLPLEVHHKNPIFNDGDEFNPDNCITLCIDCHKKLRGKELRTIVNRRLEDA